MTTQDRTALAEQLKELAREATDATRRANFSMEDAAAAREACAELFAAIDALAEPATPPSAPVAAGRPQEVTEWRQARAALNHATEVYNSALRHARAQDGIVGFGKTRVDAEYAAYTEAGNLVHRLSRSAMEALYGAAALSAPQPEAQPAANFDAWWSKQPVSEFAGITADHVKAAFLAGSQGLNPAPAQVDDNTTPVDRGALRMAINVLRRAGKAEVADALEGAAPALAPVAAPAEPVAWEWFDSAGNHRLTATEPADYELAVRVTPLFPKGPK